MLPTLSIPYSDCAAPPTAQHSGLQTAPTPICGCGSRGTGTCRAATRSSTLPAGPLLVARSAASPSGNKSPPAARARGGWRRSRASTQTRASPGRLAYVRVAALEQPAHRALEEGQYLRALPIRHHRGAQHRRRDCRRHPRRVRATLRKPCRAPRIERHRHVGHIEHAAEKAADQIPSTTTTSQSRKSVRLNRDSLSAFSLKRYGSIALECSREVEGGIHLAKLIPQLWRGRIQVGDFADGAGRRDRCPLRTREPARAAVANGPPSR